MTTRMRIDDGNEAVVDPNQIWARARMMAADPGLDAVHEWERREPGPLAEMPRDGRGAWRRLEAMRSGGGAVALGRRMKMMDGEKKMRRYIFGGSLVPGEATDRDYRTFSPGLW